MKIINNKTYETDVPKEIQDLMGDHEYKYIRNYNYDRAWDSLRMDDPPELKSTIEICHELEFFPDTLEDLIDKLVHMTNRPNYISGRLYHECNYDGADSKIIITEHYDPTIKEIEQYNKSKAIYDAELIKFKELELLVKRLVKEREFKTNEEKKRKLLLEKEKIEKQIQKLSEL